jgi:hypothetical protein
MPLYQGASKTILRFEDERVIYGLSEDDLNRIKDFSFNIFKDIFLASIGIMIPCLINGLLKYQNSLNWNNEILVNLGVAICSGSIGLFCLILAIRSNNKEKKIIDRIKSRKSYLLENTFTEQSASAATVIMSAAGS